MTDEEIFKQSIRKALKNEWKGLPRCSKIEDLSEHQYTDIIYLHSFAQAIFGKGWESHLMAMVLEKKPLKYLKEFI